MGTVLRKAIKAPPTANATKASTIKVPLTDPRAADMRAPVTMAPMAPAATPQAAARNRRGARSAENSGGAALANVPVLRQMIFAATEPSLVRSSMTTQGRLALPNHEAPWSRAD